MVTQTGNPLPTTPTSPRQHRLASPPIAVSLFLFVCLHPSVFSKKSSRRRPSLQKAPLSSPPLPRESSSSSSITRKQMSRRQGRHLCGGRPQRGRGRLLRSQTSPPVGRRTAVAGRRPRWSLPGGGLPGGSEVSSRTRCRAPAATVTPPPPRGCCCRRSEEEEGWTGGDGGLLGEWSGWGGGRLHLLPSAADFSVSSFIFST